MRVFQMRLHSSICRTALFAVRHGTEIRLSVIVVGDVGTKFVVVFEGFGTERTREKTAAGVTADVASETGLSFE